MLLWNKRYLELKHLMERLVTDMASLRQEVADQATVIAGAGKLITGLRQQIVDLSAKMAARGMDTSQLDDLAASIDANTKTLAAALVEGTSVATETPTAPPSAPPLPPAA